MQESWTLLTQAFEKALSHQDTLRLYGLIKLLNAVGQQLRYSSDPCSQTIESFFKDYQKILFQTCLTVNKTAEEEKTRIDVFNFLYFLQRRWALNFPDIEAEIGEGYTYQLSDTWEKEKLSHLEATDLSYLFGSMALKGYGYAPALQQEIDKNKQDYEDMERIITLLKFALPVFNRRLFLMANDPSLTEAFFSNIITPIDTLIRWRYAQGNLGQTEYRFMLRYLQAALACQTQSLKPFKILQDAVDYYHQCIQKNYSAESFLKLQHIALWMEQLNKDFPKACVLDNQRLHELIDVVETQPSVRLPDNFKNPRGTLLDQRKIFDDKTLSPFKQQQQCSHGIKDLMQQLLDNSLALLGIPPCKIGLLLLGSSARNDRLPSSDIELALLYEPLKPEQMHETDHYIAALIALMELQIIHLGESNEAHQGVWLDESTSFRSHLHLRGSPEAVFQNGILNKQKDTQESKFFTLEKNPRQLKLHSFLYDPSAYSLIQPLLVNKNHGGEALYQRYQTYLKNYLDAQPDPETLTSLCDLMNAELKNTWTPDKLTNRQMIALFVWWDILRCLPDHTDSLKENKADLKKLYHKPLIYFALSLRLYYDLPASNMEEVILLAKKKNLLSENFANFWLQAITLIIQKRIHQHFLSKKQDETLMLETVSPEEKFHLTYWLELFGMMQEAMECYFYTKAEKPDTPFDLDALIKAYFIQSIAQKEKNQKICTRWFIAVTGYLLYTKASLDQHRYYYRHIPEPYRQKSLRDAQDYFLPIQSYVKSYGLEDTLFLEKLWDAPLPDGERLSHDAHQAKWRQQLLSLFNPYNPRDPVSIDSLTLSGKFSLDLICLNALQRENWIDAQGTCPVSHIKKTHPEAKNLPGNHLVIPYPAESPRYYLKFFPEYPLLEWFFHHLAYRLSYDYPQGVDIWRWQAGSAHYPVLISGAVQGISLQEVLNSPWFHEINLYAFGQTVLIHGLACLEDNKPDNTIVVHEPAGLRFCAIDTDRAFVIPFKENKVNVKDIIFCLPSMEDNVSSLFMEEMAALNPYEVIQGWITAIQKSVIWCIETLGVSTLQTYLGDAPSFFGFQKKPSIEQSCLLPPFCIESIETMIYRLTRVRKLCEKAMHAQQFLTHWQLLNALNERLASHYYHGLQEPLASENLREQFYEITQRAYRKGQAENFTTQMDFKTQAETFWQQHAFQNAEEQIIYWKTLLSTLADVCQTSASANEIKLAFEQGLTGDWKSFEALPSKDKQTLMAQTLSINLTRSQQLHYLNYLEKKGIKILQPQKLYLKRLDALNNAGLDRLLQRYSSLTVLSLEHCPSITEAGLAPLLKPQYALRKLQLCHLPKLKYLQTKASSLPDLVKLTLISCEQLLSVILKGTSLSTLIVEDMPHLQKLETQSQHLSYLRLQRVPSLKNAVWHRIVPHQALSNLMIILEDDTIKDKAFIRDWPVFMGIDWSAYPQRFQALAALHLTQGTRSWVQRHLTLPSAEFIWPVVEKLLKETNIFYSLQKSIQAHFSNIKKDKDHRQAVPMALTHFLIFSEKHEEALFLTEEVIGEHIKTLTQGTYTAQQVSMKHLRRLRSIKEHALFAPLQTLLKKIVLSSHYPDLRAEALQTLAYLAPQENLLLLQECLKKDSAWQVRLATVSGLAIRIEESMPDLSELCKLLINCFGDVDGDVRRQALHTFLCLAQQAPNNAINCLINFPVAADQKFSSIFIRLYSQVALLAHGLSSPDNVDGLLKIGVKHSQWTVRAISAEGLGYARHRLPKAVKALQALSQDEKEEVHAIASTLR